MKQEQVKLSVIEEFFKDFKFPQEPFPLDKCTTVHNAEKAVKVHIEILKSDVGKKKAKMPYYERLLNLYNYFKNEKP